MGTIRNYKIIKAGLVFVGHMNWSYFELLFEGFVIKVPVGKMNQFFYDVADICDIDPEDGVYIGQELTGKIIRVEIDFGDYPVRLIHLLDDRKVVELSKYKFANE